MNKHIKLNFFTTAENVLNKSKKIIQHKHQHQTQEVLCKVVGVGFPRESPKITGYCYCFWLLNRSRR